MTAQELNDKYHSLYDYMSRSNDVENMKAFGSVMTEMMEWMIANKPEMAQEWIERLCAVRWKNYLTKKEADLIVSSMRPSAPWTMEQWKAAMEQHGYGLDDEPHYNRCAMYVVMNMVMSDSGETLVKFIGDDKLFDAVHALAVDKLLDVDDNFNVRRYFGV